MRSDDVTGAARRAGRSSHPIRERLVLALAGLCLLLVAGVASALADDSSEQLASPPTSQEFIEAIEFDDVEPQAASLTDPATAEELPHRDLGRDEAQQLLEGVFDAQLESAAGIFNDLSISKFLAQDVAVVPVSPDASVSTEPGAEESDQSDPDAQGEVAEATLLDSSMPLRAELPSGELGVVDLSLEHVDGKLRPVNPLTDVELPHQLEEGIELPGPDVTIKLADAPGDRVASVIDQSAAFIPNVAPDTDLAIAPTPTGVETLTHLRSADAPLTQVFTLQIPAGATLIETDDGGAAVMQGGETLVSVGTPTALDAEGTMVPVSMKVKGTSLVVQADPHPTASYPILVDPLFQTYDWIHMANWTQAGICNSSIEYIANNSCTNREEWGYERIDQHGVPFRIQMANHDGSKTGLYITTSQTLTAGDRGSMVYAVPRYYSDQNLYGVRPTSYIAGMTMSNLAWYPLSSQLSPYMFVGIWDSSQSKWVSYYTHEGLAGHGLNNLSFPYVFSNPSNTNGKVAYASITATETNSTSHSASLYIGSASVQLADNVIPSVGPVQSPTQWANNAVVPVTFTASDSGLGVHSLTATTEGASPATWKSSRGCIGVGDSACPRQWKSTDAGAPSLAWNPSAMPQGINYLNIVAEDPVGNKSAPASVQVKVDHAAPRVALSGTLTEQSTVGTSAGQYALEYSASDGDSAAASAIAAFGSAGTGEGKMELPVGVGVDPSNNIFVVDRVNSRVEKFSSAGSFLGQFGMPGSGKGMLSAPSGLAVDSQRDVWVADTNNNRLVRFNDKGEFVAMYGKSVNKTQTDAAGPEAAKNVCTAASGNACQAGIAGNANGQFNQPRGIALTPGGNLLVADTANNRIQKLSPQGEYLAKIGSTGNGPAQLNSPFGVAVAPDGSIWVADTGNHRIQKWTSTFEYLLQAGSYGEGNGQLKSPGAIVIAASGNPIVSDSGGNRVQVFQANGIYLKKFGSAGAGASQFQEPRGLALDSSGNIVVADAINRRVSRWSHPDHDPQSGVAKVQVKVDNETPQVIYDQACAAQNCTKAGDWIYDASDYSTGQHSVKAIVTDAVGIQTEKSVTVNSIKDETPPQLNTTSQFFNAPDGWLEQREYAVKASASDSGGSGIATITLKVDGQVVRTASQSCINGGCSMSLGGAPIDTSAYKGGAHPAELIATDLRGLTAKKVWTINVDPKGSISTAEAQDTLEAVESTSLANPLAPPGETGGYYGITSGIGLEEASGSLVATGTAVPLTIDTDPAAGATMQVLPDESLLNGSCGSCSPSEAEQTPIALSPVDISPVSTAAGAGDNTVVNATAVMAPNTSASVDTIVRPLYDGLLAFKTIRDASAPIAYSWDVGLSPGQTLKAIDNEHAAVYYEDGRAAYAITAEPAHDAVGSSVPTSVTVSEGHIVTLNVEHRSAGVVYPVLGGMGWQGGFISTQISGPKDEQELKEEQERIEREEREAREAAIAGGEEGVVTQTATQTLVSVGVFDPPIADRNAPGEPEAGASSTPRYPGPVSAYTFKRKFKIFFCDYNNPIKNGVDGEPLPHPIFPSRRESLDFCRSEVSGLSLLAAASVHGWFHYNQRTNYVWIAQGNLQCDKRGPEQPAMVNCEKRPSSPSRSRIYLFGNFRFAPLTANLFSGGAAACLTVRGSVEVDRSYRREEPVLTPASKGSPCSWP